MARRATQLFGRAQDRARLLAALDEHPLVTVTGPGGVGKTALALSLLSSCDDESARAGLCLDLTPVTTAEGLWTSLAASLALQRPPGDDAGTARAAVLRALSERAAAGSFLLVLDNAEGVVAAGAASEIEPMAAVSESLRVLVTSREPLGLDVEARVELEPLSLAAARELLLARGQRARPSFAIGDDDEALLDELLERLDRLPLAIELAAARLEILTLVDLRERLDKSLAVLRRPGGPGRHVGMHAALEASWTLLATREQHSLARCAVFAGSFDLAAVEAVLELDPDEALDSLQELRRRSLVRSDEGPDGRARFRLLETIRAFAREKLAERGDLDDARAAHARCYGALGAKWVERGDLLRVGEEMANLEAALTDAPSMVASSSAEAGLALSRFLALRGHQAAQLRVLRDAERAANATDDPLLKARVHVALAEVLGWLRPDEAPVEVERALANLPDGRHPIRGAALSALGFARARRTDLAGAAEALTAALDHLPEDRPRERGLVYSRLSAVHGKAGRLQESERYAERALALLERADEPRTVAIVVGNLGVLQLNAGRLDAAEEQLKRAAALCDEHGHVVYAGATHVNLGNLYTERGDYERAREHFAAAREHFGDAPQPLFEVMVRTGFAILSLLSGDRARGLDELAAARLHASDPSAQDLYHLLLAWERCMGVPGDEPDPSQVSDADLSAAIRVLMGRPEAGDEERGTRARIAHRFLTERARSEPGAHGPTRVLEVRDGGIAFALDGVTVDLSRRGPVRRLFVALVKAATTGRSLTAFDLAEAGWPEDKVQGEAALNRVYATVRTLRKLGLDGVLVTSEDGYAIDPDVVIRDVDSSQPVESS